tara:strand:+ start:556 stop:1113 length:558 start_codon:yes stop_codon:yes gene_type:complete
MFFQNIELYETDKFQYLLIHKNGSTSIRECMKDLNPVVTNKINFLKVRWTVIREPFNRFISGLKYDLKRHGLKQDEVNHDTFHNSRINLFSREKGDVNHSASQVPYLINTQIDWYIEMKDLPSFLRMHFGKSEQLNQNDIDYKDTELNLDLDEFDIRKHLDLDYYVYKQIVNSPHLWKWQQGRIF